MKKSLLLSGYKTSINGVDLTDQFNDYFIIAKTKTYRWSIDHFLGIFDYMIDAIKSLVMSRS